jgi:HEAT repeat protein
LNALTRRLLDMLQSDSPDRRRAAAIVLGELRMHDPIVLNALGKMIKSPDRTVQAVALDALAATRSPATIRYLLPLLEGDEDLRRRTEDHLAALGPQAVPILREAALRDPSAGTRRRRSIIGIIARAGGRKSVSALLGFLSDRDPEIVRMAGVALRHGLKALRPREKTELLRRIQVFLKRMPPGDPRLAFMAIDLLATFDQAPARQTLARLARKGHHPDVRRAALLGLLRYLQGKRPDPTLVRQLLGTVHETPFQPVASTALDLLYHIKLGREYERDLVSLLDAVPFPIRKFAIRKLAALDTPVSARAILGAAASPDPVIREVALESLQKLGHARKLLLEGFLQAKDPASAAGLATAIEGHRRALRADARRRIVKRGWDLWIKGDPLAEPTLSLGRSLDPKAFHAEARRRAPSLKRAKKYDALAACLRMAARTDPANDDLRFELALAELKRSPHDIGRGARIADPALDLLTQLLHTPKFPLLARFAKERTFLGPEDLFYLGFHFSEFEGAEREFGGDLLRLVLRRSPRTKFGRAARNKLKLQSLA